MNTCSIIRGDDPAIQGVEARVKSTLGNIFGEGTPEYRRLRLAADLDATTYVLTLDGHETPPQDIRRGVERGKERALALLRGEADGAVGFAVVVATPDDVGGPNSHELKMRARQNVIGEMFWFAGRLGRDRVCVLVKGDIDLPSDFAGIVYTPMDDHGGWKAKLLRELDAAGYKNLDWKKALA